MSLILGIDIGGTGSRAAIGTVTDSRVAPGTGTRTALGGPDVAGTGPRVDGQLTGPRVEIGPSGSNVLAVIRSLVRSAATTWAVDFSQVAGIGIGATGVASLAADPATALSEITDEFGVPAVAAIDAVTAHLGALGGTGGAITALGTGAIAIAHPGPDGQGIWSADWSRTDGWGHLFGDRGGGAWLGRHGLEAALRTHDGLDEQGRALLEVAVQRFGPPASWPGQFYTRNDRAGLLADFVVDIAACARSGDAAAIDLLVRAGQEAARSAVAAAHTADSPVRLALTGGVAAAGHHLVEGFRTEAARLHPNATVVEPAGGPLAGALTLGHLGAGGKLRAQDRVIWT